jgi:Kef-type K+ transport system membrane component KefB
MLLLLQVIVIAAAARACGAVARRLGQPAVVGEIAAGMLLGPSLLGWVWPDAMAFVFPAASLPALQLLSQGVVLLFMFGVGLEFDPSWLRGNARTALAASHFSVVLPFAFGVALSLALYRGYAPSGVPLFAFVLFFGTAMSITAFPVLARILEERRLTQTPLGMLAITCAAVNDVIAWSLLAFVVAMTTNGQSLSLGVHAVFVAFVVGALMPSRGTLRTVLRERLAGIGTALLPLFFAHTGLRMHVGVLDDLASWALCLAIIAVATIGKLGGTALAGRWTGLPWRDSMALGALMNTRGLMELVALNIGYDLGILTPGIFTMMVLMALATTAMTGPLLSLTLNRSSSRGLIPAGPLARSS